MGDRSRGNRGELNLMTATRSKGTRRTALLIASCVALACGDDSGNTGTGPPPTSTETLRLPLRVHLLTSRLAPIHSTLDNGEVSILVERVNEISSQTDVVWQIEAITREFAQSEDQVEQVLLAGRPFSATVITAILPKDRLFEDGWDAFLLHDLSSTGVGPGVYLAVIPASVSSEVDPAGLNDPGRILAHELGHSLTLLHVACTAAGNLMAPGCDSQDRTRLSPEQIEQAREHAKTRRPARF